MENKEETDVETGMNLDDDLLSRMILFSKAVSKMINQAYSPKKIGVTVIGLEVPHAHIHLIPLNKVDDINFSKPKIQIADKEMKEILQAIKSNL